MVRSMTGYGSAHITLGGCEYLIEIRSVNGKSADVNLKTSYIPRTREIECKQMITKVLQRGSIDVFVNPVAAATQESNLKVNTSIIDNLLSQIREFQSLCQHPADESGLLCTLLKMPEVIETRKKEIPEEDWPAIESGFQNAIEDIEAFRIKEGARLGEELLSHVSCIEGLLSCVETQDPERIETVKKRIHSRLEDLSASVPIDEIRFEQELIYYLEKMDITEEKVRLKQHCTYFRQTLQNEEYSGRKLNFIAQEMGREINTMGSKANHAAMQQNVVKMKDELEKIKEQVLNVL